MELALATLGDDVDLRSAIAKGSVSIRSGNGELADVIDARSLGREIRCVGTDEVILDVDAITGDVCE